MPFRSIRAAPALEASAATRCIAGDTASRAFMPSGRRADRWSRRSVRQSRVSAWRIPGMNPSCLRAGPAIQPLVKLARRVPRSVVRPEHRLARMDSTGYGRKQSRDASFTTGCVEQRSGSQFRGTDGALRVDSRPANTRRPAMRIPCSRADPSDRRDDAGMAPKHDRSVRAPSPGGGWAPRRKTLPLRDLGLPHRHEGVKCARISWRFLR